MISSARIRQLNKLTLEAAGLPVAKHVGELATEHVELAMRTIKTIAETCPHPDMRLSAATLILEQAKQQEIEDREYCLTDFVNIANLAADKQYDQVMLLYGRGELSRNELETILQVINAKAASKLAEIQAQREAYEREQREKQRNPDAVPPPPPPLPIRLQ